MAKTELRAPSVGVLKRVVLGRAFSSSRLEHTLLPKVLALPVFASDALSSVAYATGEILIVLFLASSAPQAYVMPIALAISTLSDKVVRAASVMGSIRERRSNATGSSADGSTTCPRASR